MLKPWEVCNLFGVSMWDSGRQLWVPKALHGRFCSAGLAPLGIPYGNPSSDRNCGPEVVPIYSKHTVSPRAPVWYRPKALRCLSLGRCAICLEFRCGTLGVSCETATRQRGLGCPNVAIGRFCTEGGCRRHSMVDSKHTVSPRAPVWYRPKALRCLSLGRCAICLEFRCGTLGVSCETATRQRGLGCPNVAIGRFCTEGGCRRHSMVDSKHTVSPRAPVWYRPKALRCLSLGRCAICLEFRCGTLGVSCETATRQRGLGCPNVAIGRFCTEGGCRRHSMVDSKHTVSPRAPVWYRPKALRCLSLGRCAICLEFRCGTLGVSCETATRQRGLGCPNVAIGRFCTEGGCRRHSMVDSKHTVSPRAPVWYRPKALRCLSLGRCAICLEFRCGTLGVSCETATRQRGLGCPNVAIGRFCTEGGCRRHSMVDSKHTVSPRAPVWYRPKALRCLSLGRCAICLEFRCGTLGVSCETATHQRGLGCPNVAIGRFCTEGGCRRHSMALV
ncbi:unnamed protein product [Prunus armeniaca]